MAVKWVYRKPYWGELVEWDALNMPRPVGEWWFNDNSGPMVSDTSGNCNHGTLTNMDPATDWVPGPTGTTLDFDASNDYVIAGLNGVGRYYNCTVVTHIKCHGAQSSKPIMAWQEKVTSTYPWIFLQRINSSSLRLWNNQQYLWTGSLADDVWCRIAYSRTISTGAVYLDGIQSGAAFGTGDLKHENAVAWYVGNGYNGYWSGQCDQLLVFDEQLSTAQIQALEGRLPLWQPTYYSIAAAVATPKIPLAIFKAYDRRAS